MKITFIGSGVMGEAIIRGVLSRKLAAPEDIVASDIIAERLSRIEKQYGVRASQDNRAAINGSDVIVLAVKPQDSKATMADMYGALHPDQLVLSIIAGTTVATISRGLLHPSVARAMPNTPASIGEGISVWTASDSVSRGQKDMARSILAALGKEIYVPEERFIDMATAVSGSGPAYIFLVMEALVNAAVEIGLPPDMARELVTYTVRGATCLAQTTDQPLNELISNVASRGGTTERGLLQLEEGGLRALFLKAVLSAYERAKDLGR